MPVTSGRGLEPGVTTGTGRWLSPPELGLLAARTATSARRAVACIRRAFCGLTPHRR